MSEVPNTSGAFALFLSPGTKLSITFRKDGGVGRYRVSTTLTSVYKWLRTDNKHIVVVLLIYDERVRFCTLMIVVRLMLANCWMHLTTANSYIGLLSN